MRQIRTSGLMSGEGEQSIWPTPQATAPFLDFTENKRRIGESRRSRAASTGKCESRMIAPMNRIALSLCAASALVGFASPARADFSACLASLRADGARAGVSSRTLDVAFNGLQPDMKVLEFQKEQPEFKTPIWDYVAGLVDEERVTDGKAAMAKEARALARAEETYGVSRTMLAAIWGVEFEFRRRHGQAPARAVALDARLLWRASQLFPLRADGDAENHRSWRRAGRQADRVLGGSVRTDAVHAIDVPASRRRFRGKRAARHRRFRRPTRSPLQRITSPGPAGVRALGGASK